MAKKPHGNSRSRALRRRRERRRRWIIALTILLALLILAGALYLTWIRPILAGEGAGLSLSDAASRTDTPQPVQGDEAQAGPVEAEAPAAPGDGLQIWPDGAEADAPQTELNDFQTPIAPAGPDGTEADAAQAELNDSQTPTAQDGPDGAEADAPQTELNDFQTPIVQAGPDGTEADAASTPSGEASSPDDASSAYAFPEIAGTAEGWTGDAASDEPSPEDAADEAAEGAEVLPTPRPAAVPGSLPDVVSFYTPQGKNYSPRVRLGDTYTGPWKKGKDIGSFEVIASDADFLDGSFFGDIFGAAWKRFPDADSCKIGYTLRYTLDDGSEIRFSMLSPSHIEHTEYIECWLYDDYHREPHKFYSHLKPSRMKSDTLITSIKLTAGSQISHVTDIWLTAFICSSLDDFDGERNYIGDTSCTIHILKQ